MSHTRKFANALEASAQDMRVALEVNRIADATGPNVRWLESNAKAIRAAHDAMVAERGAPCR